MLKNSYNCEIPEERTPADTHTNPIPHNNHYSQIRPKSISKGINTVSLSKRTQMSTKIREFRRPIFSPNGHQISSDSHKQFVPVVQVQLTSTTKRKENSVEKTQYRSRDHESAKNNNQIPQHQINQYSHQKKELQTMSPVQFSHQHQIHYNNILSIMRDQLSKSLASLQKKTDQQGKKNKQAINLLSNRLKETQMLLQQKTRQLSKLKDIISQSSPTNLFSKRSIKQESKNSTGLNSYTEYISGKIRDVDNKIKIVLQQQIYSAAESVKTQNLLEKIKCKVDILASGFVQIQFTKFNNLCTRITKFLQSRDKMLQSLQSTVQQISLRKQKQSGFNYIQVQQRINLLKLQHEKVAKIVQTFALRDFKYDNFQIENLKNQIKKLSVSIQQVEGDKKILLNSIQKMQGVYRQNKQQKQGSQHNTCSSLRQKSTTSIQTINLNLKNYTESIPQPSKQFLMNSKLSFTGQTCSFEDYHAPNESSEDERDHFFYPQQNSQFQCFTDEDEELIQEYTTEAVVQLTEAIKKRKMKTPVRCTVNQGYVKIIDTGAYILDLKGSLLQFSSSDIQTAVQRNLIQI